MIDGDGEAVPRLPGNWEISEDARMRSGRDGPDCPTGAGYWL